MTRRSFLKKAVSFLLLLVAVPSGAYYYAREIEPSLLHINKHLLRSRKIESPFDQFKIVHFSDTHIGFHYTREQLKDLVQEINALQPNIICFTGDLIDNPDTYSDFNDIATILSSIQATHGKFWVYGNHDHGGYGTDLISQTMEDGGFTLLRNDSYTITEGSASLQMAGLDDGILGQPRIKDAMQQIDPDRFTCMLAHEPDLVESVKEYPVDVQLSGHSHGGQIRLPLIGALITPRLARKYVDDIHHFPDEDMKLFVSRGIGTTRLPLRFLCKPEINVYTLSSDE